MARPLKNGVDYFPLDVSLDQKFELIEAEFGLKGFAVVVKLLQRIYGQQGYYCEWTDEVALLFSRQCGELGGSAVSEIITASIKRGIFDRTLYEKYSILTSKGIQKRYFEAIARRKNVVVDGRYLLVSDTEISENVNINLVNVDINQKNDYNNSQSKVKESKVNKTKVRESEEKKHPHGEYNNVFLTEAELQKLQAEFPDYQNRIERLSEYMESTGKKYRNHYVTIKSWSKNDFQKPIGKNKFLTGNSDRPMSDDDFLAEEIQRRRMAQQNLI